MIRFGKIASWNTCFKIQPLQIFDVTPIYHWEKKRFCSYPNLLVPFFYSLTSSGIRKAREPIKMTHMYMFLGQERCRNYKSPSNRKSSKEYSSWNIQVVPSSLALRFHIPYCSKGSSQVHLYAEKTYGEETIPRSYLYRKRLLGLDAHTIHEDCTHGLSFMHSMLEGRITRAAFPRGVRNWQRRRRLPSWVSKVRTNKGARPKLHTSADPRFATYHETFL